MSLSTHVLDTSRGRPAGGVAVRLDRDGATIAEGRTDADGRLAGLDTPAAGVYRLVFETERVFGREAAFYPEVTVAFRVTDPADHYHVPLLISPFGYSTYRGS